MTMKKLQYPVNQDPQAEVSIDRSDTEEKSCHCGGTFFQRVTRFGRLPATHPKNPTGQGVIVFQRFVCFECGEEVNLNGN